MCVQKFGRQLLKPLRIVKKGMGRRKTKARHCLKNERNFLNRSRWRRAQRNSQECEKKTGKTCGSNHAVQKTIEHHESGCKAESGNREEFQNTSIHETTSRISTTQNHEDHIAGKGFTSMSHYNLVRKFIPMPQARKYPMQRPQWIKNGKSSRQFQHGIWEKVKSKKEVILEAPRQKNFLTLMDMCHLENAELEPKLQKKTGSVVLQGDMIKDDSGAYAVFTEGASASQNDPVMWMWTTQILSMSFRCTFLKTTKPWSKW